MLPRPNGFQVCARLREAKAVAATTLAPLPLRGPLLPGTWAADTWAGQVPASAVSYLGYGD